MEHVVDQRPLSRSHLRHAPIERLVEFVRPPHDVLFDHGEQLGEKRMRKTPKNDLTGEGNPKLRLSL